MYIIHSTPNNSNVFVDYIYLLNILTLSPKIEFNIVV